MSTLNARLADQDYVNWVKATLCLQYVKGGLENFAEEKSQELHDAVLKEVQKQNNIFIKGLCPDSKIEFSNVRKIWTVKDCNCQDCTRCIAVIENEVVKKGQIFLDPNVQELHDKVFQELRIYGNPSINGLCAGGNLHFNRNQNKWELKKCNCYRCHTFVDEISTHTTTFTFKQSNFNNSDIQQWHTEHWQLAKLFMNQGQDKTTISARDTDISGLLNFIDNCDKPKAVIQTTHNIKEVRDTRNRILHTADMKITKHDFSTKIVPTLIALLQDPWFLATDPAAQEAVVKINEVEAADFIITKENEEKILKDLATELRCLGKNLNTKIDDLRTELNRMETTVDQETKTLQENLERELQDREKDKQMLEKRVQILEQKVKDDAELFTKLSTDINTIKTSIEGACQDIDQLKSKMRLVEVTCEHEHKQLKRKQAELAADIEDLKKKKKETPSMSEEEKAQKLQQYLKDGYDKNKLNVPVLLSCHGLPVSEIFAPVILTKEAGESENVRFYKALFFKDNDRRKKIFLLGKAGAGKTTFCKHLTDIWCSAKVSPQFVDAEVLKKFRYLFHVACRFAEASESIFDMICYQLFHKKDVEMIKFACEVLKNTPDECLVVVDGIDEWKGSASEETGKRGDIPGLPSSEGLEDCVVLFTSRPERIHMLPTKLDKTCNVLELHGIQNSTQLIRSILEEMEDPHPVESCDKFLSQIEESNMDDLIQFPLMLINALNIWDMNKTLSSSKCVNYSNMVEGLFSRAKDAKRIAEPGQGRRQKTSVELPAKLPDCFLHADLCKQNTTLIINLGNLAFDLLFGADQNSSLMFSEQKTRKYLTEIELKTCLAVGILSKAQTISRSIRKVASFSFCHKTFEEFLGALWLSTEQCNIQQIKSIDTLLDNAVCIRFLCGLSPNAGDRFWQYIVEEVMEKDEEVTKVRLGDYKYSSKNKVKTLQELVLECIREARNADLEQHRQLYYFIPDIYIDEYTDERDITLINDLVEKFVADIKSLTLYKDKETPFDIVTSMKKMQSAISISLVGNYEDKPAVAVLELPDQLKVLSIEQWDTTPEIELPKYLTILTLKDIYLSHSGIEQMLTCLHDSSTLRYLHLDDLECTDHGVSCCFPELDLQRHHLLETVKLFLLSVKSVLLPGQGTIPLPLTTLTVFDIELSHSSIEELFSSLRVSSTLRYLCLVRLHCRDHDGSCCLLALDLQRHRSLEEVELVGLSVESVLLPGQGTIPSSLKSLTAKYIKLSHSGIEELFSCVRVSSTLRYLYLWLLHCNDHGERCYLPALDLQRHHSLETVNLDSLSFESVLLPGQLERQQISDIDMVHVYMSTQKRWRSCLYSLPHLPYRLKWVCRVVI